MKFEFTADEIIKIDKWIIDVNEKRDKYYFGAIGGAIKYSFTPTSLGVIKEVEFLNEILDLSCSENW